MLSLYLSLLDTEEEKSKLEKLYYEYRELMKYIALGILNDEYTAEDAVHNAFIKLTRHLKGIEEIKNHKTKSFIVIIIKSVSLDMLKKEKKNKPAEMHLYDNELWISFPELGLINIYNKNNFNLLDYIDLGTDVYSFDKYNNYIFYAQENDRVFLKRYDITTKNNQTILEIFGEETSAAQQFYEPAILVDKNTSSLYVAETNMSSCKLYAYNIDTMEKIGVFESAPSWGYHGFPNYVRKILLVDGYIFWFAFKIDPKVWWKPRAEFTESLGILYIGKHYSATTHGIFDSTNGKKVVSFRENLSPFVNTYKFSITKCNNIMIADGDNIYIFYG